MNQDNFSVRFENRFIMVNYDVIMSGLPPMRSPSM